MNLLTSKGILQCSTYMRFNALSKTANLMKICEKQVHSPFKGYLYTFL